GGTKVAVAVACVEGVIANEFPNRPVEVIRPGLGEHIHDAASDHSKLRAVDMRLHFELLHRIDDRQKPVNSATKVSVYDSIHVVEGFAVLLPEKGDFEKRCSRNGRDAGIRSADTGTLSRRNRGHARRKDQKRSEVPTVQRELLDLLRLNHIAEFRR